jgi:hypothetical protein
VPAAGTRETRTRHHGASASTRAGQHGSTWSLPGLCARGAAIGTYCFTRLSNWTCPNGTDLFTLYGAICTQSRWPSRRVPLR